MSTNLGAALRPLLERSTDATLVLRSDGVLTYASPAVRQLFGWSDEDIVGAGITGMLHPEDRDTLGHFLQRVLVEPGAHPPVELRVRRGQDWVGGGVDQPAGRPDRAGVVCNVRLSLRRTAHQEAETHAAQLETALDTRVIIEQAKGYLAGRLGITVRAAVEVLAGTPVVIT